MSSNSSKWTWGNAGKALAFTAWAFLGFMLAQAIGYAVVSLLQWSGVPLESLNETAFNTVANFAIYSLALVIIIGVPWWVKRYKTTLADLGLQRPPHWKDFLWLLAGIVGYIILTLIVNLLSRLIFPSANYDEVQNVGFTSLANYFEYTMAFLSLVIIAPVAEEVLFRGYLFGKLRKYSAVFVAIILSSLLFAVAHFQFNVGLDTFALGVVLCLLRFATGTIWASIMLHMLKNGVAFYFLYISPITL